MRVEARGTTANCRRVGEELELVLLEQPDDRLATLVGAVEAKTVDALPSGISAGEHDRLREPRDRALVHLLEIVVG